MTVRSIRVGMDGLSGEEVLCPLDDRERRSHYAPRTLENMAVFRSSRYPRRRPREAHLLDATALPHPER